MLQWPQLPGAPWPPADRVLVEQLRMVHANAPLSFGVTVLVAALTVWLLQSAGALVLLWAWLVCVALAAALAVTLARRFLQTAEPLRAAAQAVRATGLLYSFYGGLWGLLPWLTLDQASPVATIWLLCAVACVLAGGGTLMAPVLPAFNGFALLLAPPLALKLMLMTQPGFFLLGVGVLLMLLTLLGQAARTARLLHSAITLRLAHETLAERLREESARAERARADADAARQGAERANLAKSKFLAAASHDLRQPIHAQGLFLEVLAGTPLTQYQSEVLASARSASAASAQMLDTLLDFSRIEAGVVKPHTQTFALQTLFHNIENDLAPLADAKALAYRTRETGALVDSDPALVELILRNLMSNAIRYTERGGVLIGARRRGAALVVEVRDTGIGIALEHQQEVFREFHQLGNSERDRRKGLGLGLAIAQGLANALGHALTLSSTPGRGSVFRLSLPASRAAAAPAAVPPAAPPAVPPAGLVAAALAPAVPDLHGVRVLVLDDDESVRTGMAHLLHSWGCVCDTAGSISEALALAQTCRPALLITDYRLREQHTGAQAIAALRAQSGTHLPALMITGDTAPERLREALAAGVPLLHKPVLPARLFATMTQLLPVAV